MWCGVGAWVCGWSHEGGWGCSRLNNWTPCGVACWAVWPTLLAPVAGGTAATATSCSCIRCCPGNPSPPPPQHILLPLTPPSLSPHPPTQGAKIDDTDWSDVVLRKDQQMYLCSIAAGTNPVTGVDTRESLVCP